LAARGIACLIVDGPGNGESVRFRGLYLHHETERYGKAAYEYLANRPEFDAKRIGIMAISLGGYYAPRAAAFEQRFACCIAWGAQWDYWQIWKDRFGAWRALTHCRFRLRISIAVLNEIWEDVLKHLEPLLTASCRKSAAPS
jgi:hypothetical protein